MSTLTASRKQGLSSFVSTTFLWMFGALLISAICALWFANSPDIMSMLVHKSVPSAAGVSKDVLTGLGWVVLFAPLAFGLFMIFGYESISASVLSFIFLLYSAVNGMSFSFILLHYTAGSVFGCFLTTAVMFGVFAIYGYTTKKDLTSWGNLLFMALIGIIISLFINMLLHSAMLDYLISIIGVIVFTGLTAYDVQKIKENYYEGKKGAIMAAFTLYLDFVNLFLYILRLFGNSKD